MARTIWKYELSVADRLVLSLPRGATLLHMARSHPNTANLWAEVDPDAPLEPYIFAVYGTGHPLPETPGMFVGTFVDSPFVWHVYLLERGGVSM